jgi:gamma-butyrobetaine dioxygenase
VELEFDNAMRVRYYLPALIDSSPDSFHPQTQERCFDLVTIPDALSIDQLGLQNEGQSLRFSWVDTGGTVHFCQIPADYLFECGPGKSRADPVREILPVLWEGDFRPPVHQANEILHDDVALFHWLLNIRRYGLTLVEGLDRLDTIAAEDGRCIPVCTKVAERIGFLRETNFGRFFNVVTEANPNNLAYTSLELPLHTDLPNQEMPPGLQFLHCLANESQGGESTFADGFTLANTLRTQNEEAFTALSEIAVPYRFHDQQTDIRIRRPVIQTDGADGVTELRYNAHILDRVDLCLEEQMRWYPAYKELMKLTKQARLRIAFKLQAGQMVCFDNRRVLHGRTAFNQQTGRRHLQGCYVDRGEFESRLRVLGRSFETR